MALAARWGLRGLAQMAAWGLERVFGYHMAAGFSDAGSHGGLPDCDADTTRGERRSDSPPFTPHPLLEGWA
eukprot:scaffold9922_cov86-Isochrysis_galbana.AAC.5